MRQVRKNALRKTTALHLLLGLAAIFTLPVEAQSTTVDQTVSQAASDPPKRLFFRLESKTLIPAEVTVPPGLYEIVVLNSVVNGAMTIRLGNAAASAKVAGASAGLINENTRARELRSRHIVTLPPGHLLLTLGDSSAWTAVINVTAP